MGAELSFRKLNEEVSTPALDELDPKTRAYVLHYVLGDEDIRGVQYKCYKAAGFAASNNNVASVGAATLMRKPEVQRAIKDLREEMEKEFRGRMRPWAQMAVQAQNLMARRLETLENNTNPEFPTERRLELSTRDLILINMILDRCLGKPKLQVEMEIGNKLDEALKRVAEGKNTKLPALPAPRAEYIGEAEGRFRDAVSAEVVSVDADVRSP